ncbi:hypothetical protein GVAV_001627 [Gurleya vavrai]
MFLFIKIFLLCKSIISILCGNLENEKVLYYDIELKIPETIDKNEILETTVNNFFQKLEKKNLSKIFFKEINNKKPDFFIKEFPHVSVESIQNLKNIEKIYVFLIENLHTFFINRKIYFYKNNIFSCYDFQNLKNQIDSNENLYMIIKNLMIHTISIFFGNNLDTIKNYFINSSVIDYSITFRSNPQDMKKLFLFIIYKVCYFLKISKFPDYQSY